MPRSRIIDGRWTRQIPKGWVRVHESGIHYRSDMFKTVLDNPKLKEAEFICPGGLRIIVPAEDLRRILPTGVERGVRFGPFNIDPISLRIEGHPVRMQILPAN